MSRSKQGPTDDPLVKLTAIAVLISIPLGLLPVAPRMFGYNFLPTYKWMSTATAPGLASGFALATALLWLAWKGLEKHPGGTFKKIWSIAAAPLAGFLIGKNAVLIAPPMILALVAGHQVESSFTVARADAHGSKGCRSPVELRNLPFFFDSVCRVGSPFRKAVSQGTEVKVIGHGTELGLFVEDIRRAGQAPNDREPISLPLGKANHR